jgi:hypothetical protein
MSSEPVAGGLIAYFGTLPKSHEPDGGTEKVPLSVPGGLILLLRREPSLNPVTREDV